MACYQLHEISRITGGTLTGDGSRTIQRVITDTRQVVIPGDSVFVAIRGMRSDGHAYLEDAYKQGIRNFLIRTGFQIPSWDGAAWVSVNDPLTALQQLAGHHRRQFTRPVLAITGSNGKTILKEWLFQVLQEKMRLVRSPRSYNSQIGVPLSVWMLEPAHRMGIFEAGISRPGEMSRLAGILRPDYGIITNVLEAHQENFASMEEKTMEKLELFRGSSALLFCADQEHIVRALEKNPSLVEGEKITWSMKGRAYLQITSVDSRDQFTRLEGVYRGRTVHLAIPFADRASVENAAHAWLFLLWQGHDPEWISGRMEKLVPVAMRLELKKGINHCTLINDSYNSDVVSLRVGLEYLSRQNQHGKRTLILSDIRQSGMPGGMLYREVADMIGEYGISRFYGIGPDLLEHRDIFPGESRFYPSTESFLAQVKSSMFTDQAVLLKGSREFRFENISAFLEEKAHQTVLEIDLNALVHNLNYFRSLIPAGTRIMVMVKAFSYGSGSHEIAGVLQFHRADYLAVAYTDEAVELREGGITLPIMVMNPEEQGFEAMIRYRLEPELYSFRVLDQFLEALRKQGEYHYPVHIKLDTGMHRLGFMPHETEQLVQRVKNTDLVKVASVFSHLAGSDDPVLDDFTRQQIDLFRTMSEKIAGELDYPVLKHILNSGGIERFPEACFDMVRLGIGLYGISSQNYHSLQHVGTLRSVISQIKRVGEGETVGYNRRGKAGKGMLVGVVPVGYADGLNRKLGNGKGKMLVQGKTVPLVGDVCMDMCMIDVTGLNVKEGDEVIIFGKQLPVSLLAEWIGTIPYEVLTSISSRVKRVYYHE